MRLLLAGLPPAILAVLLPFRAPAAPPAGEGRSPGAPRALVALVEGTCTARAPGATSAAALRLLDPISGGSRVETGRGARLVVVFLTGERFELGPESSAAVADAELAGARGTVRPLARVSPRVALAPLAAPGDASPRAGAVRVRGGEDLAMYPAGGAAVDAADAVLRFSPVPGAEKYAVAVEDEAGNTVFSAQTGATKVALPREVLGEGAAYFWRVRPRGHGLSGTAREERFVTLAAEERLLWEAARASLPEDQPDLRNLLAATAIRLGLGREACLLSASPAGPAPGFGCEALARFLDRE